jgi:phage I-like protein
MDPEPDGPIECRAAVELPGNATAKGEIPYLPTGIHEITPIAGGIGRPIRVLVDQRAAIAMEERRLAIIAKGKRPFLDLNHDDSAASFRPSKFIWRDGEGVVCLGAWTGSGKKAVDGKDYCGFSPVFHVDNKRADPARVIAQLDNLNPNMGGLVNDPAFNALALWSKNAESLGNAGATGDNAEKEKQKMETEEIAALRAKHQELETRVEQLTAIVAQNAEDEPAKMRLTAAEAEAKAAALEIETAELKAKGAQLAETIHKHNRAEADAAIKAAVASGRILPKDLVTQEKWRTQITVDPAFKSMLESIPPNNAIKGRITDRPFDDGSRVIISNEDPLAIYTKMARILSHSAKSSSREEKAELGTEFAAIYAGAFKDTDKNHEQRTRLVGTKLKVVDEAIKAADVTDANLGTIAGTLVTQRTLELLKFVFPPITRFTTDFSDQPANYNQTVITRIVSIPSVVTYSTATGWADVTATTTDVSITINNHKGIPITFNENLLASTMRQLFNEFAEASAYALGKAVIDALYANLTDANFTNNTVSTSASFNRSAVVDIGVALDLRGVPLGLGNRTMLLWPAAFGNLKKDTTFVQFGTNVPQQNVYTEGITSEAALPINVETFQIYTAPNMPSNNANLVGFAGSKSALCIATRTPNDYTTVLPGASFGNVQMVTDPDIGITVMQVQYVNHTLGTATSRLALMWGTAAGQTAAGQLIKASAGSGSSR